MKLEKSARHRDQPSQPLARKHMTVLFLYSTTTTPGHLWYIAHLRNAQLTLNDSTWTGGA